MNHKPYAMTIQENNSMMQRQLRQQANKSREQYERISSSRPTAQQRKLAIEHLTRAIHFDEIANNLLIV